MKLKKKCVLYVLRFVIHFHNFVCSILLFMLELLKMYLPWMGTRIASYWWHFLYIYSVILQHCYYEEWMQSWPILRYPSFSPRGRVKQHKTSVVIADIG
jgi:hypothetical protein